MEDKAASSSIARAAVSTAEIKWLARVRTRRLRLLGRQARHDSPTGDLGQGREMRHAGAGEGDGRLNGRPNKHGAHEPGGIGTIHEDRDVIDPDNTGDASTIITVRVKRLTGIVL